MTNFFQNSEVNELVSILNNANPDFIKSKEDFQSFIKYFFTTDENTKVSVHYSCINNLKNNNYYDKILDFELVTYNPNDSDNLKKNGKPKLVMGYTEASSFIALYNPETGRLGNHYDWGLYSLIRQYVEGCSEEEYLKLLRAEFCNFQNPQLSKRKAAHYFMLLTKFFTDLNTLHSKYFTPND